MEKPQKREERRGDLQKPKAKGMEDERKKRGKQNFFLNIANNKQTTKR